MFNKKCGLLLALLLLLVSVSGVCATEPDTNIANFDSSSSDNLNNYTLRSDVNDDNDDCIDYNKCYINVSDFTLDYGTRSIYPVYVYDYLGNPVNEGVVSVILDNDMNQKYYGTVINGKADVTIYAPYNLGTHKATIYYNNDEDQYDEDDGHYWSHGTTANINVVKTHAYIYKHQTTAYYKSGDWFMFHVYTKDTAVMGVELKVNVYTGGSYKSYYIFTGSGCALLSADKVSIGSHKAVVSVCDPNVKAKPITTTITLKKAKTKVSAPKVRNFYKSKKYFKVTVKNSLTGKPISNLKLKLTVYTGKKHENYHVKTNSKGVAKLSTKHLKIGPHKVLINAANSKYSVKSKSSIIIKKKVIKSIMTKIKLIKPNSWNWDIPYKKIGGNDCIYSTYDPHFSPQDDCSRGTHIDLCGVDSMEPYSHLLVKAKIYFKNKKGKIITKTCKSDGYGILKIAPKGYIPYKAKVYYYHT